MLKTRAGNVIIIGLSEKNLEKLKDKQPIFFKGGEVGVQQDFLIFYGQTERDLIDEIRPFMGPDTKTRIGKFTSE